MDEVREDILGKMHARTHACVHARAHTHAHKHRHAHTEAETHDTQRHTGIADAMSFFHAKFKGDIPGRLCVRRKHTHTHTHTHTRTHTHTHTHTLSRTQTHRRGPVRPDVAVFHEVFLAVIAAHVHIAGVVVLPTVIVMLALIQRDALEFEIRKVLSGRLVVVRGVHQRSRG